MAVTFAELIKTILTGNIEIERRADHVDEVLELVEGFHARLLWVAGRGRREEVRCHLGHTPVSLSCNGVGARLLVAFILLVGMWFEAQRLRLRLLFCLFVHLGLFKRVIGGL